MITLQNVTLYQGTAMLLNEASFSIYQGQKLGVIGRNGCGKSTLFRLLMGDMHLDGGTLAMPEKLVRAQMLQETEATGRSAVDHVLDGHKPYRTLMAALDVAEANDDHNAMAQVHAELLDIRLNLAQALIQPSDLLLLDEPTNHLDLEATLWLQEWLQRYEGTLLLISHDRQFLDEVVQGIISYENKKLISYTGNYTQYERQKAERLSQQQAAFEKQQERKAHIEDFVRRFRAQATKARQAQSRLKELQRMVDIEPAHIDSPFQFRFRDAPRQPDTVLTLEGISVGYSKPLFKGLSMTIGGTDRIGLLGPNGQGKSTLLKTIVGQQALLAGKLHPSDHMRLGYCAQHQTDVMDQNRTPLQLMQDIDPKISEQEVRNFLGSFDFRGEQLDSPIRPFSGGEKSRLALALVAWQRPNLLLMDEPTNHLDLEMVHALTRALQEYCGALILVSHDRHLLNNTVDKFLLVRGGQVEFFEGSLDDYEKLVMDSSKHKAPAKEKVTNDKAVKEKSPNERQLSAQQREALKPLREKVRKLEQQLEKDHTQLQKLEQQLTDPALYDDANKKKLAELLLKQGELKTRIAATEDEWMHASEALETANAG
jgi:ATP-binding cassette subfamily F protein 3